MGALSGPSFARFLYVSAFISSQCPAEAFLVTTPLPRFLTPWESPPMPPPNYIHYPVFKPFTPSFMRAHPVPPSDRILGPWLTESSLTLIHGSRGAGTTGRAIAHASGTPLLGWDVSRPRRVLHIDGEMRIVELLEA